MSNIDKQALREIAAAAVGAHERLSVMPPDDIFDISLAEGTQLDADITALNALNSAANPTTVLALLDELEAKDSSISTQQHEIRTLLNALEQATEKRNSDIPGQKRLIGWRASDYTDETSDPELAKNWAAAIGVLPIFEGDVNTKLSAAGIKGSRDMAEFTKEQLIEKLERRLAVTTHYPDFEEAQLDAQIFKIALEALTAGMEQEPVAWLLSGGGAKNNVSFDSGNAYADPLREVTPLYTAPPAPVSVPAAMEIDDDFDSAFEHGKAVGWNAYRAAMLQAEPVSNSDELPLDYLQGHKDGLEWAAQLAEANHPQTGDWLYDDPIDLARAIRKGPDMPTVQAGNSPVTPDGWVMVPKEPTQAMIKAWLSEIANFRGHAAGYRAAIEAAPQLEVNRG